MKTIVTALALFAATLTATACDEPQDEGSVVEQQVGEADIQIEDALTIAADDDEDAVVVEAVFEAGVDSGFYEVTVVVGDDDLIVYEVDARTGERVELARRRANADHRRRAQLHRRLRHRLAQAIREHRADRPNLRIVLARLLDSEVEIERLDRGARERIRLALSE